MKAFFTFVFLTTMLIISSYLALDLIIHATASMCSVFTPTPESILSSFIPMFMEGAAIYAIGYIVFNFCINSVKKLGASDE